MKHTTSRALVTVKPEVAEAFLPADMHTNGVIDLTELVAMANDAIAGSEESLIAAQAIIDGGWWSSWVNSTAMQQNVIQSITHIRDISKVNLGLSAICNHLVEENLEYARRINANHHATHTGLNKVKALTEELLEHLRRPREPGLLDRLLPALGAADLTDQDAMRGWLRSLSEAIDSQYSSLQANLKLLTEQQAPFAEWVDRVSAEVSSLDALMRTSLQDQKAEFVQQLELISLRLEESLQQATSQTSRVESMLRTSQGELEDGLADLKLQVDKQAAEAQIAIDAERASRDIIAQSVHQLTLITRQLDDSLQQATSQTSKVESLLRTSHSKLGDGLTKLNLHLNKHAAEAQIAIDAERASRVLMNQSLIDMMIQREGAIRRTISELNQHHLKRMLWVAGALLTLQVAGFAFLSIKMGLWS